MPWLRRQENVHGRTPTRARSWKPSGIGDFTYEEEDPRPEKTVRWTIRFGKWLATTRIIAPRASRWHATERGDAREEEPTVRTGRGENTIHVALQQ